MNNFDSDEIRKSLNRIADSLDQISGSLINIAELKCKDLESSGKVLIKDKNKEG